MVEDIIWRLIVTNNNILRNRKHSSAARIEGKVSKIKQHLSMKEVSRSELIL
jgi:hypothetical protein